MQKAKKSKNNLEEESWRTYTTRYQDIITVTVTNSVTLLEGWINR